jgi:hypothetical protein
VEDEKLKEYFKFDEADITVNRGGSLTEKQKIRIIAELNADRKGRTRFAYFMFFLAAIGVMIAVGIWFVPASSMGLRIGFGLGFGLVWPAMYGFMGMVFLPSPSYMELGLASETGRVNIIKVQSQNSNTHTTSTRYDLYIGNRRFLVDPKIGSILIQGDEYTVYYLKNSNKIVSAEFVSRGK